MELKIISGNANRPLSEEIAKRVGTKLCDAEVTRFSDGERRVRIKENVRGRDCFIIQPTCGAGK